MESNRAADIRVKSLAKALDVLNCFIAQPEYGVTELANKMNLKKSNVHNILVTFTAMNYLEQNPVSGKYRLGIRVLELNRALGGRYTVRQVAIPFMQEISNTTRERVYLAIPRGDEVLYLEAAYPAADFSLSRSLLGVRAKMYCTALGKAMMAFLPAEEIEKHCQRPLQAFTQHTITSASALKEELEVTRARGYAIDNMEHEFGVKCVARPIFDHNGQVCAALSISGPSLRFADETIKTYAELLAKAAETIQTRLA